MGREFDDELDAIFQQIRRHPEHFAGATVTVRKARLSRFKLAVYFIVKADEIEVLAIYHPSRDPASLRRRLS